MQKWWENNGNIEYWLIAKEELKTKDGNIYENNSSPDQVEIIWTTYYGNNHRISAMWKRKRKVGNEKIIKP